VLRGFAGTGLYSPNFKSQNRNKRSITLDYTKPAGLKIFKQLVASADVIVANSRPGVAEKHGVGYAELSALNPRLIYCSITGFGRDGPYAQRPAFDNVGQALSGWICRFRRDEDPRVVGPMISDPLTSYYAVQGILAALVDRGRTGRGHLVETNMLEAMIGFLSEPVMRYFAYNEVPGIYQRPALSQAYNVTCKDGKPIGLHTSALDKFWQAMCRVIGREDWIEKYPKRMDRVEHYETIAVAVNEIFAGKPRAEWVALLDKEGVPFAPAYDLDELESDPQIQHLNIFHETTHPQFGKTKGPRRPIWVDGDRDVDFLPPPALGEHTGAILAELGISEDELGTLRDSKVI
jgi:crotonobetainyl-CoA:carnitine CoA-transferase CaiB-like acyl-CoA transferase